MKVKHTLALKLTKTLAEVDTTWIQLHNPTTENIAIHVGCPSLDEGQTEEEQTEEEQTDQTSYTPLLIAASKGIVEIVDSVILVKPQGIEHVTPPLTRRLASRIDKKGYTILHHVADMKNYDRGPQPGPAFQLQEELKWFERVQKIIPDHYVMHHDRTNQMTAEELFKEKHSKLLENAQKWIKETSQSCSAVAVLVATVVFAAAYTVPGGNDDTGHPVFLHSPFFLFFTIMDVLSLASSLTSVVMFLSILSSPFEYENFRISLPRKLTLGFTLLFFSVTTTMLSFAATILLIIHFKKTSWTTTVIYTAAFLPVCVFALMQFPLYKAFSSTLRALTKKILKTVLPQKFTPRYLLTTIKRKWA
ncbi:ankyrin repeat-containing protein NPR4-like [Quercus robur]|uniref:ankyrin repeat-containing protein NPR4-like n=1 Tax=Quercus robur TaxID=38942 RepID=UPI002161C623|nr:ankyrin repeat-containing protein NPR4-like [Quercus robur]